MLRLWGNRADPPLADLELRVAPLQLGCPLPHLGPGRPAVLHQRAAFPWLVLDCPLQPQETVW